MIDQLQMEDLPSETWRPVKNFEGKYEVSSLGRIKTVPRLQVGRDGKLRPVRECIRRQKMGAGTIVIGFKCAETGRNTDYFVTSRIVYEAFVGDIPAENEVVHVDKDFTNNRVENLKLRAPLTDEQVGDILRLRAQGCAQWVLAQQYDNNIGLIRAVVLGHPPYHDRFVRFFTQCSEQERSVLQVQRDWFFYTKRDQTRYEHARIRKPTPGDSACPDPVTT